jgi:ribonuclease-3
MENVQLLEQRLGYCFTRQELLLEALTHRSWLNEGGRGGVPDNERLEFFGDSLVNFLVAEFLLDRYPQAREGVLTRLRAELVSETGLVRVAEILGLGRFLRLGQGEVLTGGRQKPSLLANAVEALVAALYLDGGLHAARALLAANLFPLAAEADLGLHVGQDRKSTLQELVQATHGTTPVYRLLLESGPPHQRQFEVAVLVQDVVLGTGSGTSKKAAEQAAAAAALAAMAAEEQNGA